MVHYGLNKIKLAFGGQYKIVVLTYLFNGLGLGLEDYWPNVYCSGPDFNMVRLSLVEMC